jgi:hypothetical protein
VTVLLTHDQTARIVEIAAAIPFVAWKGSHAPEATRLSYAREARRAHA